jgi:hypothetical protein
LRGAKSDKHSKKPPPPSVTESESEGEEEEEEEEEGKSAKQSKVSCFTSSDTTWSHSGERAPQPNLLWRSWTKKAINVVKCTITNLTNSTLAEIGDVD